MRIPMNTYQDVGNSQGKQFQLNIITSVICFLFSHKLRLFQDSFIFGEATSSHFFRVTTSMQQLLSRSSYFFRTAAFLRSSFFRTVTFSQLLFQNSFFFRAKLLQNSHFLRIGRYLGHLLFETAIFGGRIVYKKRYLQKSYFFKAGISAHQLFQESYILEKANNSDKQYSLIPTFSGELPFQSGHFFRRRYLLQHLPFQKTWLFTRYFLLRKVNISQLRLLSTATLLIYLLVIK